MAAGHFSDDESEHAGLGRPTDRAPVSSFPVSGSPGRVAFGSVTFSRPSWSVRVLTVAAIITVVSLGALLWQHYASPVQPALAGAGDATGFVPISGTAEVGKSLTFGRPQNIGDPDGLPQNSASLFGYAYQWYSGGRAAPGETGLYYNVLARDMGKTIQVVLRFRDNAGNTEYIRSALLGPVPIVQNNPATGRVDVYSHHGAISDGIEIGHTLAGRLRSVDDPDGDSHSYRWQWLRDGEPIPGATSKSRGVSGDDAGSHLSLRMQFTDDFGFEEEFVSEPVGPVLYGPVIVASNGFFWDNIDATDDVLSVDVSKINDPNMPTTRTYAYHWYYAGGGTTQSIGGDQDGNTRHQDSTFVLREPDDGRTLIVDVLIFDSDGRIWKSKRSGGTPVITERPPIETPISVTETVPDNGGSVALSWDVRALGDLQSTGFQYRYRPEAATDFTGAYAEDWTDMPGGSRARAFTFTGDLINKATYIFEVRAVNGDASSESATVNVTWRHKTAVCS